MFYALKNGFYIVYTSILYMLRHKQLFLAPLFSTACISALLVIPLLTYYTYYTAHLTPDLLSMFPAMSGVTILLKVILGSLLLYTLIIIITNLGSVITAHAALKIFQQKPEYTKTVFRHSFFKLRLIVKWSLTYILGGPIISVLTTKAQNSSNKYAKEASSILTQTEEIAQFPWSVALFLVPAVLAHEKVDLTTLVKHARDHMQKIFGSTITFKFMGPWFFILLLTLSALLILRQPILNYQQSKESSVFFLAMSVIVGYIFFVQIINTTYALFKTSVYALTQYYPTGPFTPTTIKQLIRTA